MSAVTACPDLDRLRDYAQDKSKGSDGARIKQHLVECAKCRKQVADLGPRTLTKAQPAASGATVGFPATQPLAPNQRIKAPVSRDETNPDRAPSGRAGSGTEGYSFLLPPEEPDELGRLGSYRVLRLLGRGGMGMVFLAEDISLARPVALKVMRPEMIGDVDGWKRFLREARTLAAIKHEHLVTIYQAGQEGNVVYFAMELLEGETLDHWMQAQKRIEVSEIVRLGKEIAQGLAVIHAKGLIHRDIKPANIWLEGPKRRVKILDLGLARPVQEEVGLTMTGMVLGTPGFMSPEQARGDDVDGTTDLFSLGCVLYNLCTGQRPFRGNTNSAVLMALAAETPTAVSEENPEIPEDLSALIMRLLSKRSKARPSSAQEVVQQLEAFEGDPRLAPTQAIKTLGKKKLKQSPRTLKSVAVKREGRPWIWPLLACFFGALALGVILMVALPRWREPTPKNPPVAKNDPAKVDPKNEPPKIAPKVVNPKPEDPKGEKPKVEPKIDNNKPPPPPPVTTFLTDMKDEFQARENWPFTKEKKGPPKGKEPKAKEPKDFKEPKIFDTTVRFQGKVSPHGIFMHPPPSFEGAASLTYRLNKEFNRFEADVAINENVESEGESAYFYVMADNRPAPLFKSNAIKSSADAQKVSVDVTGVDVLKIAVVSTGEPMGLHAIWVEPRLITYKK